MSDEPKTAFLPAAVLCLALGGCGSTAERPYEDLARAEAGISQAEQGGARQYAALEMQTAQEKLARARAAAENEDMDEAERLAEEAALDADLAAAKSRSQKAELAVRELEDSITTLKEEMARSRSRQGDTR